MEAGRRRPPCHPAAEAPLLEYHARPLEDVRPAAHWRPAADRRPAAEAPPLECHARPLEDVRPAAEGRTTLVEAVLSSRHGTEKEQGGMGG